ncbi:hypothetical protein RintRC_2355 [Richelia intracellularis]|nr:hypothetical protein RintRC_2355 [Richelia intracellularis]
MWLLFQIRPGVEVKQYTSVCTGEDLSIEENIRIMEQAIQEKFKQ